MALARIPPQNLPQRTPCQQPVPPRKPQKSSTNAAKTQPLSAQSLVLSPGHRAIAGPLPKRKPFLCAAFRLVPSVPHLNRAKHNATQRNGNLLAPAANHKPLFSPRFYTCLVTQLAVSFTPDSPSSLLSGDSTLWHRLWFIVVAAYFNRPLRPALETLSVPPARSSPPNITTVHDSAAQASSLAQTDTYSAVFLCLLVCFVCHLGSGFISAFYCNFVHGHRPTIGLALRLMVPRTVHHGSPGPYPFWLTIAIRQDTVIERVLARGRGTFTSLQTLQTGPICH